jgi:acetyl-CoA carboxylase biotin carboxyl carrier protein
MSLTNEDVADILALLDSLPYDELDLQTSSFRLTLRRTPDGWTQSTQSLAVSDPPPAAVPGAPPAAVPGPLPAAVPGPLPAAAPASVPAATAASPAPQATHSPAPVPAATTPMWHWDGYNHPNATSSKPGGDASGVIGSKGDSEAGDGELVSVRAPLPGTFYRAPRPGAEAFVEVGSEVGADTVVGIVETMKLMNSVTAGVSGTVAEFCVGNAEFAAQGAPLLRIRTGLPRVETGS